MRRFLIRLAGSLLSPVLILHNWLYPKERMSLGYLTMHPKFQLRLLKRSAWWLLLSATVALWCVAALWQLIR